MLFKKHIKKDKKHIDYTKLRVIIMSKFHPFLSEKLYIIKKEISNFLLFLIEYLRDI